MSPPLVVALHFLAINMVLPHIPAAADLDRSTPTPPMHSSLHTPRAPHGCLGWASCLPPHHPSLPYQISSFSARRLVFYMQHRPGWVSNRRLVPLLGRSNRKLVFFLRRLVFLLSHPDRPHPQACRPIQYPITEYPLCWSVSARALCYPMCAT